VTSELDCIGEGDLQVSRAVHPEVDRVVFSLASSLPI
jgi:hypothetical protein